MTKYENIYIRKRSLHLNSIFSRFQNTILQTFFFFTRFILFIRQCQNKIDNMKGTILYVKCIKVPTKTPTQPGWFLSRSGLVFLKNFICTFSKHQDTMGYHLPSRHLFFQYFISQWQLSTTCLSPLLKLFKPQEGRTQA